MGDLYFDENNNLVFSGLTTDYVLCAGDIIFPTPSITYSQTPSLTPSETPTITPTITSTPTMSSTPSISITPSPTITKTPTPTPSTSPPPAVWSGLTSYWRMDENTGTVTYDAVGSVNGTLSGATWSTGKNNYCVNTSGTINYRVNCGNNYDVSKTTPWSYSVWIQRASTGGTEFNIIIAKFPNSGAYQGIGIWKDNTKRISVSIAGTTSMMVKDTTSITLLENFNWNHIVWTYNGSTTLAGMKLYVNGTEITSWTFSLDTLVGTIENTNELMLGGYENGWNTIGKIDEVGRWNRVLSSTEVTTLYNSGSGLFY
jgi:hypothetical protein